MPTHLVFVYGTLKKCHRNHHLLKDAVYRGSYWTQDAIYDLVSFFGRSPGVAKGKKQIIGELYEVNDETLKALDVLEHNGKVYTRELTALCNYPEKVWMHTFQHPMIVAFVKILNWFVPGYPHKVFQFGYNKTYWLEKQAPNPLLTLRDETLRYLS